MQDEASFTAWARERQRGLLRTAYLLTGDSGRAEDLVQEALVKVALRWRQLSGENPDAYARQILYRDQVSWWRRRSNSERPVEFLPERGRNDTGPETRMLVIDALSRLSARQRQVLVLRYFEDASEKECAEILGLSLGTVKRATHDAIAALRVKAPELAELWSEV